MDSWSSSKRAKKHQALHLQMRRYCVRTLPFYVRCLKLLMGLFMRLVGLLLALWAVAAQAVTVTEPFTGSTLNSTWTRSATSTAGFPCLTGASGGAGVFPFCGGTVESPGWLRLTDNGNYRMGAILLPDQPIFPFKGIRIEFDWFMGSAASGSADGLSVFFYDPSVANAGTNGGTGGSLGYIGIVGGFLGFGLDKYGNFSGTGGSGNKFSIRGSTSLGNPLLTPITGANPRTGWDPIATGSGRRIRIEFYEDPSCTGYTPTTKRYRAKSSELNVSTNDVTSIIQDVCLSDTSLGTIPSELRIGFGAATGAQNNFHQIRNLVIIDETSDLSVSIDNGVTERTVGQTINYTILARNLGPSNANNSVLTVPAVANMSYGTPSCSASGGAVCPSGLTASQLQSGVAIPTFPAGSLITVTLPATYNGQGSVTQTSTIALPSGSTISEMTLTNNSASDTDRISCNGTALGISKACVWLKADNGASSSTWTDSSDAGMNATGAGTTLPVVQTAAVGAANFFNFNPAVTFNGGAGGASGTGAAAHYTLPTNFSDMSEGAESFVVARPSTISNTWQRFYDFGNGAASANILFGQNGTNNIFSYAGSAGTTLNSGTNSYVTTNPRLYQSSQAGNSNSATIRVDGGGAVTGNTTIVSSTPRSINYIGRSNWSSDGMYGGEMAEILFFSRQLSPANRVKVESYLALKYGITLSRTDISGNAYVDGAGNAVFNDSGTYWNSVFGIGRDTTTGLDQRVSRSISHITNSANGLMTIATTADFTSANGGSRTPLSNGQYLVAGDNGASTDFTSSYKGISNRRLNRVWKFRNTNGVGGVFLGVPTASLTFPAGGVPKLLLECGTSLTGICAGKTVGTGTFATASTIELDVTSTAPANFWTNTTALMIPDGAFITYASIPPLLKVNKTVAGRVGSSDQFTTQIKMGGVNGTVVSVPDTGGAVITTGNSDGQTFSASASFVASPDTVYTITESISSTTSWKRYTATISCSNTNSVVNATLPANDTILDPAVGVAITPVAGDDISCTITNTPKAPKITWTKALGGVGRVNSLDQFRLDIKTGGLNGTSVASNTATTGSAATIDAPSASAVLEAATSATAYTLTEAMTSGSASGLGAYSQAVACSNTLTNAEGGTDVSAIATYSTTEGIAITPTFGDDISCTVTNSPANPIIKVRKSIAGTGRIKPDDQFTLAVRTGGASGTVQASMTTSGSSASPSESINFTAALGGATEYTITEAMSGTGTQSPLSYYSAKISCSVNTGTASEVDLPFSFTPQNGEEWDCLVVNTPKAPKITLTKEMGSGGRIASGDQFTLTIKRASDNGDAASPVTTTGVGQAVASNTITLSEGTAGTSYILNEAMAAGSSSPLSYYRGVLSCTNTGATGVGDLTSLPATISVQAGDDISCTVTNTPQPVVKLSKTVGLRVTSGDKFTVGVLGVAGAPILSGVPSITTNSICTTNCGGTGEIRLQHGQSYILYDSTTADSITPIGGYGRTLSCTNATTTSSTSMVSSVDLTLNTSVSPNRVEAVITPQAGDDITCEFANSARPALTLRKSVGLLATPTDRFEISVVDPSNQNGVVDEQGSYNTKSYTTNAGDVQGTLIVKILGSSTQDKTYIIQERSVTSTPLSAYATNISCTNSNATTGASDVSNINWVQNGDYRQATLTLKQYGPDPINAGSTLDNIDCIFTNAAGLPKITIKTKSLNGVGTFSYSGISVGATDFSNGFNASTATTATVGVEVTASNPAQFLNAAGVETRILQTAPTGFSVVSVTCIDNNGSITGNGTAPTLGVYNPTDGLILPASQVKPGADLVCTFTNQKGSSTISGTVFNDNGVAGGSSTGVAFDGLQNGAETGLSNVLVKLLRCSDNALISETRTDGSGAYSLVVPVTVASGTSLCIQEVNPSGYRSVSVDPTYSASYAIGIDRITVAWLGAAVSGVNFGDALSSRLDNTSIQVIKPGSSTVHTHRFVAGALGSAGSVTFSIENAQSTPELLGWAEVLYLDANCDGKLDTAGGDVQMPTPATYSNLIAGQTICIAVQQFSPMSAPEGVKRSFTLKAQTSGASGQQGSLDETLLQNDLTTVSQQALSLFKQVCNSSATGGCALESDWTTSNQAKSGQIVVYRIRFANEGTSPISELVVRDTTPAYTKLSQAVTCPSSLPNNLSSCTVSAPSVGAAGAISWSFGGQLAPASSASVLFSVQVD